MNPFLLRILAANIQLLSIKNTKKADQATGNPYILEVTCYSLRNFKTSIKTEADKKVTFYHPSMSAPVF